SPCNPQFWLVRGLILCPSFAELFPAKFSVISLIRNWAITHNCRPSTNREESTGPVSLYFLELAHGDIACSLERFFSRADAVAVFDHCRRPACGLLGHGFREK